MTSKRRWLIPEVIQTSMMDCGPASLKSLLAGFDVPVSYARLREACQTDVDGTSINTLEDVSRQLGLDARQLLLPTDHLLLDNHHALPALVVIRLPSGFTHFVVVWRRSGRWVQIMDPGRGRVWISIRQLLQELYRHQMTLPPEEWRHWASGPGFTRPLYLRMTALGLSESGAQSLLDQALEDSSWFGLATLDAGLTMLEALVAGGGLRKGKMAAKVLPRFIQQSQPGNSPIPENYWRTQIDPDQPDQLRFEGAVILKVSGIKDRETPESRDLQRALQFDECQPDRYLWQWLRREGGITPLFLMVAFVLLGLGLTLEIALLKGLLDQGTSLSGLLILQGLVVLCSLGGLEWVTTATVMRLGRRLEIRLRQSFFEKIPRLGDRYFHSRLTSDLSQRAWEIRQFRQLPPLIRQFFQLTFSLLFAMVGLIVLLPHCAPLVFLSMALALLLSLSTQPQLRELDLRQRTHVGALSRFYYDALLGLIPLRNHTAESALRNQQEGLITDWGIEGIKLARLHVVFTAVSGGLQILLVILLVQDYVKMHQHPAGLLIVIYWALQLPVLSQNLMETAWRYPMMHNRVLRLLEPLTAPEENAPNCVENPSSTHTLSNGGITFEQVTVHGGGKTILEDLTLSLEPGEQVAIVGPSGAGKSTLAGLLLGWNRPASGILQVQGKRLEGAVLQQLRRQTVWVDPGIQLWNRSLGDNLAYGNGPLTPEDLAGVIHGADLPGVLSRLDQGLESGLGESGGRLSGGEGQRVRLGRGMAKKAVELVILDEPFRGMDQQQRKHLLQRCRRLWKNQTLLFISHDLADTLSFERVLVIENSRLIEDGNPQTLSNTNSRYRDLLQAETRMRKRHWQGTHWRRWRLDRGILTETRYD